MNNLQEAGSNPQEPLPANTTYKLTSSGARLSMAQLETQQEIHGSHPGDRYVRKARSADGFRRTGY